MGWTYQHKSKGTSIKDFFTKEFSWSNNANEVTVLDVAVVGLKTAYVAIKLAVKVGEETITERVSAIVCLLDYRPHDYHNFGYKDIEETSGPYYYSCPKRILDLLTDTFNETAIEWRGKCRDNLTKKALVPKMRTGLWLWLSRPVTFASGDVLQAFYIQDAKKRNFRKHEQGYVNYNLPKRILDRGFEVLTGEEIKQRMLDNTKIKQEG